MSQKEYEKKYREVLSELSKYVGAAANTGDVAAFQFLIKYTELIFQSGFEVLQETFSEVKSKTFSEFAKKLRLNN